MSADDKRPRMNYPHLTRTAAKGKISLKQPIEMIMYGPNRDYQHYIFWLVKAGTDEVCSGNTAPLRPKLEDKLWQTYVSNKQRFTANVSSGDKVQVVFDGTARPNVHDVYKGETYVIDE
jgi:hypothetical protein